MRAFIGVDWGTTNLRAWRISIEGHIENSLELPLGIGVVARPDIPSLFERTVHAPLGPGLPVLMCGMVGSTLGWRAVDYLACPADSRALANGVISVAEAPSVRIVPGLNCDGLTAAPDLMRGEETQIAGWLARAVEHQCGRRLLCLPGTHAKWAIVDSGAVTRFVTAMTGELFHVLATHSILKSALEPFNAEIFLEGLAAAGDGDCLALKLFSARARSVTKAEPEGASYLSGLLIGAEIGSARKALGLDASERIVVIGTDILRERYVRALSSAGFDAEGFDGVDAAIGGLRALVAQGALQ